MRNREPSAALELRRSSQELAAAWIRGRATFVLDSLAAEEPMRAALIATLVYETLNRCDRYDSKRPNEFRRALLARSQGLITPDELAELEREYRRVFGFSPPPPQQEGPAVQELTGARMTLQAQRIRAALTAGKPLARERDRADSVMFLRLHPERR